MAKDKLSQREQARIDQLESLNRSLKLNSLAIGYLKDQRSELLRAKNRLVRTTKTEHETEADGNGPETRKSTPTDGPKPLPFRARPVIEIGRGENTA